MRLVGNYKDVWQTSESQVLLLEIDDVPRDELEALKGKELFIDITEQKHKRSLNANAYFWKLCTMIAGAVGSDKDTIYLLMLKRYGVFETIEVIRQAIPFLEKQFAYIEEVGTYTAYNGNEALDMAVVHCFYGSHDYNTAEMAKLINGAVNDATELKLPTLTEKELERIKQNWRK